MTYQNYKITIIFFLDINFIKYIIYYKIYKIVKKKFLFINKKNKKSDF